MELLALARELGDRPVLMPTAEDWVAFMAGHRAELESCYRFVQPPAGLLSDLTDKASTYELARSHGLDVPRHLLVENASDLAQVAAEVGYPCVLKPARSGDWRQPEARAALAREKLLFARDAAELRAAYERASPFAQRHLVQEWLPGPDSDHYYVVSYVDRSGVLRGQFVHRKLLMRPPGRGVGCLIASVHHDDLAARTSDFLLAVGYRGLAGVEFKHDRRDGRLQLLDLNPRWGQGDSLAAIAGIDMAWLYYCDCLGLTPPVPDGYQPGLKWVQLRAHLAAAWAAHRERRGSIWRDFLNLSGRLHHSVLALDDLRPAGWMVRDMFTARLRSAARRRRTRHASSRRPSAPQQTGCDQTRGRHP
jgi:predicted ATP-grasp superfamily ATP-dependent carboligase